jgi:hypothetical protein
VDKPADLLVHDPELLATVDDARREIAGGWVAVTDSLGDATWQPDRRAWK